MNGENKLKNKKCQHKLFKQNIVNRKENVEKAFVVSSNQLKTKNIVSGQSEKRNCSGNIATSMNKTSPGIVKRLLHGNRT